MSGYPIVKPDKLHLQVASILQQGTFYILMGAAAMIPEVNKAADTWNDNLQNELLGKAWNLQTIITGLVDQILDNIREHNVVAVLDGSYQTTAGAAAWIIEGATSHNRIQGSMIT